MLHISFASRTNRSLDFRCEWKSKKRSKNIEECKANNNSKKSRRRRGKNPSQRRIEYAMNCIVKHLLSPLSQWISIVLDCQRHSTPQHKRTQTMNQSLWGRKEQRTNTWKKALWFRFYLSYGVSAVDIQLHTFDGRKKAFKIRDTVSCFPFEHWTARNRLSHTSLAHIYTHSQPGILALSLYLNFSPLFFSLGNHHSCSNNLLL